MEKTFLFYDLETSGLNPAFDQILSFAAIRTRLDLTPIDRTCFFVKLRRDIIPSAGAFLTHQLALDELNSGLGEYDAACKIHTLVNQPGTISLGYNSMGFDDEFLRFTFYRNLLDPYTHQYSNGCSRMDLLPVTVLYRVFNPKVMAWPEKNGRPGLKLEDISNMNQFVTSGRAHEAISDVEATIELAKRLRSEPKMWSYSLDFFDKLKDEHRIQQFDSRLELLSKTFKTGIMVSAAFGPAANYLAPVLHIGESIPYSNQHLWLPLDKSLGLDGPGDGSTGHVIRKRYGDQHIILPFLDRFQHHLTPDQKQAVSVNHDMIHEYTAAFHDQIAGHMDYRYPEIPDMDPDAGLYQDGFFSHAEKKEMARFHQAGINEKIKTASAFQSSRIRILANRILFRNFNDGEFDKNDEYAAHVHKVCLPSGGETVKGYRNDTKLNRIQGLQEIMNCREALKKSDSRPRPFKILDDLERYIRILPV